MRDLPSTLFLKTAQSHLLRPEETLLFSSQKYSATLAAKIQSDIDRDIDSMPFKSLFWISETKNLTPHFCV